MSLELIAMLVLSRKKNESIVVAGDIVITVIEIRGDKVRLGIEAPREVPIHRSEVYASIHAGNLPGEALPEDSSSRAPDIELPGCTLAVCTLNGAAVASTGGGIPLVHPDTPTTVAAPEAKAPGGSKPRTIDLDAPSRVRMHVSRSSLGADEAGFDADFEAGLDLDGFSSGILPD
jgi:carbon storage regulator